MLVRRARMAQQWCEQQPATQGKLDLHVVVIRSVGARMSYGFSNDVNVPLHTLAGAE
jgi:hypothetical protein